MNNSITIHEILSPQEAVYYIYKDPESLQWTIENDTMRINVQICQKSILKLGGRTLVAWFNPGVPISDGGYKF